MELIGKDCENIILDYKKSIEDYEQNFTNIDECLKNKQNKTYDMSINLKTFYDYCLKKNYIFHIKFNIKINNKNNIYSTQIQHLNKKYLEYIKVKKIQYNNNNFIKSLNIDIGSHNTNEYTFFKKIILNSVININNNSLSEYYGKHLKYLFDTKHIPTLLDEYFIN